MAIPVDPFGRASPAPPPSASISPARSPQVTISPPREAPSPADPLPRDGAPPATTTPGGTLLVPSAGHGHTGTKTPRRVQWTSDSHIVSMHPIPPVPGSPSGTLDESNIDEVKAALESHRKNPNRRRPPSMIGGESSGDDDARAGTDEDYDYRLDVDPPAPDLETSVRPVPEHTDFQNILDNGMDEHVTGYIPFGETDGLPNIQQTEAKDELGEAKNIVRAHSGKWGVLRRRVRGAGAVNRAFAHRTTSQDPEKAEGDFVAFASRYPEPRRRTEREGHSPMGHAGMLPIPGGASVLSSLLALYGQQNLPSGTTSGATSRASSENGSSDDEDKRRHVANDSHRHVSADDEPHDPYNLNSPVEVMAPNESHLKAGIHRGFGTSFNSKSASSLVGHPPPSPGFLDLIHKAKEQIHDKDRPKAARSGAGVFGALVQNTSSLSGAATPAGAALAPAAKRPGYQLSRYSLPDATASAPSTQPWRPDYRSGSRPASVRSSTAVSRDGESPKGDQPFTKTVSSDDMLSMRTENIRPKHHTLESLGRLSGRALKEGGQALKQTEKWILSGGKTQLITPPDMATNEYFARPLTEDERRRREWEAEKKNRKKQKEARKKQEIFIIQHVAAILARHQFILKLARALMMFGSPSHRLETQIQATAKVLEINAQVVYLPGIMLISFGDDATHTSETKFLKQATGLDLGKLLATHHVYWNVVHDKISVDQASKDLDLLMTTPVYYSWWQTLLIGAACSAFITVIGFNGSFIDALMAVPLGMLLVGVQMLSARNDMFNNVFEIAIATLVSFIAAALASTHVFCFTALVSGGVVLILPGYIVLCGALELASRNITSGAVRIGYSVIYSLFLGFGISIGAELYQKITGNEVFGPDDYTCSQTHSGAPWYQQTPSGYWWFLCAPAYSFFLSLRNQQPLMAKELPIMVVIACAGWTSNHFSALAFPGRSDITSAIGSFVVGTLGNIYGRFSNGSSFPVTVTGILFQLPSGLSNGGIFNFAAQSLTSGSSGTTTQAYSTGFSVAQQLISVAIGLTVGLFVSAVVTNPFGGGRRSGSGIFSF